MSLLEKYKPTNLQQVLGNKLSIQTLTNWLQRWPAVSPAVLVSGPCGVGKTLVIDLLVKPPSNTTWNSMEVNTDDDRTDTYLQKNIKPFTQTKRNMWGKANLLIVNDVDVANDHGFLGTLCSCIKETKIPIILTCNDRYDPKIKTLAALCTDFKFLKPSSMDISRYITEIVKKELNTPRLTPFQTQTIHAAAERSDGDVRNALLTTEFNLITVTNPTNNKGILEKEKNKEKNDKDKIKSNLFELTTDFMSQFTDFPEKVELFAMEKELLPLMVHENYPLNILKTKTLLEKLSHLSLAAEKMSDYDLFPFESGSPSVIHATQVTHVTAKVNFTGYLGKMSTKAKKGNVTTELESKLRGCGVGGRHTTLPVGHFRLDYMSYMLMILYNQITDPLLFLEKCVSFGFTKEDIQENLGVLIIPEGVYSRCDYSSIDKKIKTSLTKLFTKQAAGGGTTTATKSAKKRSSPASSRSASTPAPKKSKSPSAAATEKKKATPKKKTTSSTSTPVTEVSEPSVVQPPPEIKTRISVKKKATSTATTTVPGTDPCPISTPSPPPPVTEVNHPPVVNVAEPKTRTTFRKKASTTTTLETK
jgi:DNA polymerase III delta prime subunit